LPKFFSCRILGLELCFSTDKTEFSNNNQEAFKSGQTVLIQQLIASR